MKFLIQSLVVALLMTMTFSLSAQDKTVLDQTSDFEEAKKMAADKGGDILMLFTGSDWCRPCIMFKKSILQDEAFVKEWGNKLVLLYLDFPMRKKNKLSKEQTAHNERLAAKFNKSGAFPKIVVMDAAGKVKGKPDYTKQSPSDFSKELKALK